MILEFESFEHDSLEYFDASEAKLCLISDTV